jgi:hypothetical protein
LLVAPNLVKLGRSADNEASAASAPSIKEPALFPAQRSKPETKPVASLPLADWLQKNAPAFHQAFETVRQRRGKTILHENLAVARVSDLSLKVALEKALGKRIVPLGEEFLAFPSAAVAEVERLVAHLGHVVKRVDNREP